MCGPRCVAVKLPLPSPTFQTAAYYFYSISFWVNCVSTGTKTELDRLNKKTPKINGVTEHMMAAHDVGLLTKTKSHSTWQSSGDKNVKGYNTSVLPAVSSTPSPLGLAGYTIYSNLQNTQQPQV